MLLMLLMPVLNACGKDGKEPDPTPQPAPEPEEDGTLTAYNNRYAGDSPSYRHPGYIQTDTPTDTDSSLVANVFSATYVSMSLLTDTDRQYVGFYDGNHQMTIAQRVLPDGPWAYCKLDEFIHWDPHNTISMIKDPSGCLLVTGNMHDDPLVFFSTDETGDISTLKRLSTLCDKAKESSVTYPKFMYLSDGRLLFHYRDGRSGSGNEVYLVQNADATWSPYLDTPLIDGTVGGYDMSAYMTDPTLGPDGYYHLVWVWRDSYLAETCHDLSYARSKDLKTWYSGDGTPVTLPMDYTQKSLIADPVPVKGGINNSGLSIGFGAQGEPLIGYYKFDENGYSQVYIARYEKSSWVAHKVSKLDGWRWYFEGSGTLVKQMTIGAPTVEDNGQITIRYRRYQADGTKIDGMECWLNASTLETEDIKQERSYNPLPAWAKTVSTPYSGTGKLQVNYNYDLGNARYLIRWESLGNNRDVKPTVEIPPASEMRVIKY